MSSAHASSLETIRLRKEYPGTVALKELSLRFVGGEIHALVGKNGAGKSTLVKIFAGAVQPTSGTLLLNDQPIHLASPRDALDRGIVTVHQELSLVSGLSVAENILLGRLPRRAQGRSMLIDWPEAYRRARAILDELGMDIDVRALAGRLGVARQQAVEIARAMSYHPSVLMLDEPTSALAQRETDRLFELLRQLAARGVVLLYISHRLQELGRIADRISVLRNGELAGTIDAREVTPAAIAAMMFGTTVQQSRPADLAPGAEPVLEVKHLTRPPRCMDISFTLARGEILGVAGLLGAGRTELLRAIFGADLPEQGTVTIRGTTVRPVSPQQMRSLGVALVPEDRKAEGLVQGASTLVNLGLASLARLAPHGLLSRSRERGLAHRLIADLGITAPAVETPVSRLSGGNQQKVVVGKWLATDPQVILFDEPTRGIDVQAKQQMFQIVWDLSRQGISAIVVSSELEELIDLCHRILIMRDGRLAGEVRTADITLDRLFALCMQPPLSAGTTP